MSKLDNTIYKIHHMDELSARDLWINRLHPLVKLCVTIYYIVTVISFQKYDLPGLIGMVLYPVFLFLIADLSFKESIWHMRIMLPIICLMGLTNLFFDRVPVEIGSIRLTAGCISMVTLILKGIFSLFASYALIATTPMERICYALRQIHIPKILVTQLLLTYRYMSVLLQEVNTVTQAYALRAPRQKGVHYKVWGSLAGQLLLRSIDRANAVYESMLLRGYNGEFLYLKGSVELTLKDIGYLLICILLFTLCRRLPIVLVVGNLIGGVVL